MCTPILYGNPWRVGLFLVYYLRKSPQQYIQECEWIAAMEVRSEGKTESFVVPSIVPPSGAYSHGIVANGLLFTCGIGPNGIHSVTTGGIEEQARQTFRNLESILNEKNLGFESVVKMTAYLHDVERDFEKYDGICREFLVEPYPVRTTVGATLKGILICIDLVAQL